MNLTIDHGNSRTKLALWRKGSSRPFAQIALRVVDAESLDDFLRLAGGRKKMVDACCLCSVAGGGDDALRALLSTRCHSLLVLEPENTRTPLRVGYRTPETLGADRLAAVVGAWSLASEASEVLVVDVGTAVTYDLVSDGVFVGGNIAPGINMRLRALNRYTARLPLIDSIGEVETWGRDTAMALRAGAVDGVVAEIEFYRRRLDADARVILTGGAASLVAPRLSFDAPIYPDLVCLGLNIILQYNSVAENQQ